MTPEEKAVVDAALEAWVCLESVQPPSSMRASAHPRYADLSDAVLALRESRKPRERYFVTPEPNVSHEDGSPARWDVNDTAGGARRISHSWNRGDAERIAAALNEYERRHYP